MSIEHSIARIRQKPEHIRRRYVYGCVGLTMIVVLLIWFFHMKVSFAQNTATQAPQDTETLTQLKDDLSTLRESYNLTQEAAASLEDAVIEDTNGLTISGEQVSEEIVPTPENIAPIQQEDSSVQNTATEEGSVLGAQGKVVPLQLPIVEN